MNEYYMDDSGVIYNGDCLHVLRQLPSDSVDAVCTDPPYSSGGLFRSDRTHNPADKYLNTARGLVYPSFFGDNRDQHSWGFWCSLWISEAARILKEGGYFFMFSDWRQLPTASDALQSGGIVWRGVIVWDKTSAARAPHKNYFKHQCEYILWGSKGKLDACYNSNEPGPFAGLYSHMIYPKLKQHLTAKPVALIEDILAPVKKGCVVLDPFLGSGTTACACVNKGLKFIGVELSQQYCEISRRRLLHDCPIRSSKA